MKFEQEDFTQEIVQVENKAKEISDSAKNIEVVSTEEIDVQAIKTFGLFGTGKANAEDTRQGFSTVNNTIMKTNESLIALNNVVQEIPIFLEGLTRDQLKKIAISQKTANNALKELGQQYEVLKKFKIKIDKLEHITSVDTMYYNLNLQEKTIATLRNMIKDVQENNEEIQRIIEEYKYEINQSLEEQNLKITEKLDKKNEEFNNKINACIEIQESIKSDNTNFNNQIIDFFNTKQIAIDDELIKYQNKVTTQLSGQNKNLEEKSNQLMKSVKTSYYLSGTCIFIMILMLILIVFGVI